MQTKTINFSVDTLSLKDIHEIRHRSTNALQEGIQAAVKHNKVETIQELEELAVAVITLLGKTQGVK